MSVTETVASASWLWLSQEARLAIEHVRDESIRRFSAAELGAMIARGESRTDLVARVQAKTEEELERGIASDPDFRDVPENWYETAQAVMPVPRKLLLLRLDSDIVDWFKSEGPGYQTRMNAVLPAFVQEAAKRRA